MVVFFCAQRKEINMITKTRSIRLLRYLAYNGLGIDNDGAYGYKCVDVLISPVAKLMIHIAMTVAYGNTEEIQKVIEMLNEDTRINNRELIDPTCKNKFI